MLPQDHNLEKLKIDLSKPRTVVGVVTVLDESIVETDIDLDGWDHNKEMTDILRRLFMLAWVNGYSIKKIAIKT